MSDLIQKKCVPCEGGTTPLSGNELQYYLRMVSGWQLDTTQTKIVKQYQWPDFAGALNFVNQAGILAENEGHHPDLEIFGYNKVKITLFTHAISGLSENDFIMAAKIDELVKV